MKELLLLLVATEILSILGQNRQQQQSSPPNILENNWDEEVQMERDSEISRCTNQVSNTFFNQGLRLAVASIKPRLAGGLPDYGIPPMDPLSIEGMTMEISRTPIPMNISLYNMKAWNLTAFTKNHWFLDVNTRILDMSLTVPRFLVTGQFIFNPMGTKGNITIEFLGVTIRSKTKMKIIDTSRFPNETPIKADKALSDMQFEKVKIQLSDLFYGKGMEDVNYALKVFIERYSEMLYDEVRPIVNSGTGQIVIGITDAVLSSVVFHRRLPTTGILPGFNLSALTNWYDRMRNALQLQLPSSLTRSTPYRSIISMLEAAFRSCRSYTDVTNAITQPFVDLFGLIVN